MCDNQTNRSRGISDNTAFTAACSVLQTMSVSSSRRYRYARDSNTVYIFGNSYFTFQCKFLQLVNRAFWQLERMFTSAPSLSETDNSSCKLTTSTNHWIVDKAMVEHKTKGFLTTAVR